VAVNVTLVPAQIVVEVAAMLTLAGKAVFIVATTGTLVLLHEVIGWTSQL
jgi:hypothetical protein